MRKFKLLLNRYPRILNIIRFTRYLIYRYIINTKWSNYELKKGISFIDIPLSNNKNSFFGYYNISPWNEKGDILFCETDANEVRPNTELEIKLFNQSDKKVYLLSESLSWNWQQGCMLQWLGNNSNEIIFNIYSKEDDKYFSKIIDINIGKKTRLCMPIYSVSPNGKFALTLNFSRLAELRPDYGYFNKKRANHPDYDHDGIWKIDFDKNDCELILSLNNIINFQYSDTMADVEHKVNHIDISPDNRRFMFLHRWINNKGRFMRLLTADIDGKNLYNLAGNEMVSHSIWKSNNEILSFCRIKGIGDKYILFIDKTKEFIIFGSKYFHEDGHPSFSPDKQWMLTDTYPDLSRMSFLLLYNESKDIFIKLGRFYQPIKFNGEIRCDLHPKWSRDGKFISFDSCHNGKRCIYILDVSRIVK